MADGLMLSSTIDYRLIQMVNCSICIRVIITNFGVHYSKRHMQSMSFILSLKPKNATNRLHGSYEALKGGTTSEALEDMTGGLTEFFDLDQSPPKNLMSMMMRGFEMGSLFGVSIEADPNVCEAKLSNGLIKGHAYSVTGMRIVSRWLSIMNVRLFVCLGVRSTRTANHTRTHSKSMGQ